MKVLILDDEKDICTLLRIFFEKKQFEVFTTSSLIEGLRIIDEEHPKIVFILSIDGYHKFRYQLHHSCRRVQAK